MLKNISFFKYVASSDGLLPPTVNSSSPAMASESNSYNSGNTISSSEFSSVLLFNHVESSSVPCRETNGVDKYIADKTATIVSNLSERLVSDCLHRDFLSEDIESLERGFRSRLKSFMDDSRVFRVYAFEQRYPIYFEVSSVDVFKLLFREIFQGVSILEVHC